MGTRKPKIKKTNRTISDIGEFPLIDLLHDLIKKHGHRTKGVTLGIGDDAACFTNRPGFELLVTCDSLVEGRHYVKGHLSDRDLGRRAMAVNISDIGAMGGRPLYAFISLGLKAETPLEDVLNLYRGFLMELNPFQAGILGGNLTSVKESPFIDITLVGEVEKRFLTTRAGAKVGDKILVTGFPGQSYAGLQILLRKGQHPISRAYCRPVHRAREGWVLAKSGLITSMIDTSDGLLGDLGHICEKSLVGALLEQNKIPLNTILRKAGRILRQEPYALALQPSDDYELVLTCQAKAVEKIQNIIKKISPVPLTVIGTVTKAGHGISLLQTDGNKRSLLSNGWDHFKEKSKKP